MTAIGLGEVGLLLRADGADHVGAEIIRPLAQDEADAARRRMDQHVHAFAHLEGAVQQILDRHALEHHAGGLLIVDRVRQLDGAIRRQVAFGRIGAERHHIADAVAHLEVGDARPQRQNLSGAFVAGDERQSERRGIEPAAKIRVDEIDAAGMVLDAHLALAGRRQLDVLVGQDFGPAVFVHPHRCDHDALLRLEMSSPWTAPGRRRGDHRNSPRGRKGSARRVKVALSARRPPAGPRRSYSSTPPTAERRPPPPPRPWSRRARAAPSG